MIDDYLFDKDYLMYLKNKKSNKDYLNIYKNLFNIVHSEEYNILINEYNDFINNVYKLFLELNVVSSLEVALFYNKLLFDGFFSSDYNFSLNDPIKYDLLVKTWGSRVCTGDSVCRHNVMFLVDLERKFNNDVECVDLVSFTPKNLYKGILAKHFDLVNINHLAIGLNDKNNLYLYDPTNYIFLLKSSVNNKLIKFMDYDYDLKKVNELRFIFNINENNNIFDYNKALSIYEINHEYIFNLLNHLEELFQKNDNILNEFHLDNSKKIRKIKFLNNEIIQKQNIYK